MRRAAVGCGCSLLGLPLFAALLFADVDGSGYAVDFCIAFAAGCASALVVGAFFRHVEGDGDEQA